MVEPFDEATLKALEPVEDEGEAFGVNEAPAPIDPPSPVPVVTSKRELPKSSAFVQDQLSKYPDSVRVGRTEIKILDLSIQDDIDLYSQIKTEDTDPDNGLTIVREDLQYNVKTSNWKVFIELQHMIFLPLI